MTEGVSMPAEGMAILVGTLILRSLSEGQTFNRYHCGIVRAQGAETTTQ